MCLFVFSALFALQFSKTVLLCKYNKKTEGVLLTQKALTKKLVATYCSATNTCFIHKKNKAHNVYTVNSEKIIRNLSTQQKTAFNLLQNTCMQKTKNFVTNNALIKMLYNK